MVGVLAYHRRPGVEEGMGHLLQEEGILHIILLQRIGKHFTALPTYCGWSSIGNGEY